MHGYQFRLQLGKHSNSRTNENAVSVAMTPRRVGVPRELSIKVVVNGPGELGVVSMAWEVELGLSLWFQ